MTHELPDLGFDYDALEPHIDEKTMRIHHTKHHQGYVNKLIAAVKGSVYENMDVDDILSQLPEVPESIRTKVRNAGGGHSNHRIFWKVIGPNGGGKPSDKLMSLIERDFGSFEKFKEKFNEAAGGRFGSGWAWLCMDSEGKLSVISTPNQDSPYTAKIAFNKTH